jgi:hypothetical protein
MKTCPFWKLPIGTIFCIADEPAEQPTLYRIGAGGKVVSLRYHSLILPAPRQEGGHLFTEHLSVDITPLTEVIVFQTAGPLREESLGSFEASRRGLEPGVTEYRALSYS